MDRISLRRYFPTCNQILARIVPIKVRIMECACVHWENPRMKSSLSSKLRQPYFMAVVLGTALAAMNPDERVAASEISPQAITNISRYCSACWRNARLPQDHWN